MEAATMCRLMSVILPRAEHVEWHRSPFYRRRRSKETQPAVGANGGPGHLRLSCEERAAVLEKLNAERFVDISGRGLWHAPR
jgi:hypothetical protein